MPDSLLLNARDLEQELAWFAQVLDSRFKLYFNQEREVNSIFEHEPPDLATSASMYAKIVQHYQLSFAERLMLILSLVPHIRPRQLDVFFTKNATFDRKFTEFGGVKEGKEGDFFPTGETLVFILAGLDLELRFKTQALFDRDHFFSKHQIFDLQPSDPRLPLMKAPLRLTEEYLNLFTTGLSHRPHFSNYFPACPIETQLTWKDLVLSPQTLSQVREIETWLQHGETLLQDWGMARKLRPGFRALFYGPPGTGKTMTACLLGNSTGLEVYRVDLSMVVSKYIGETEKNLARVFDRAENKQWILFFDEADALFGKRSETKDSHDRYANQEVAYLLQRIETFNGIAILASNLKENLDKAFARRFENIVFFPLPKPEERLRIWQNGFSDKTTLAPDVDLQAIAQRFELSGGAIMNVIRYASLEALRNGSNILKLRVLQQGIKRELVKEGKVL